jgi:hypothetical protein
MLKIALVKQEVYQDLYVCSVTEKDASEVLFSSQMRVGPIGLIAELGADFYIVKAESERETRVYRRVIRKIADHLPKLRTQTIQCIPGLEFAEPGSPFPNGKFAVDCRSVDWSKYDVVISINISLPTKLILTYPRTLFGYMIGEANTVTNKTRFGYDVALNQMARGLVGSHNGQVDFPYTFLKGDTLEKLMRHALGRPSEKKGIFMEINSTTERPVTRPPEHFAPLVEKCYPINLHRQKISDNLKAIYDSKYFLKMGGRRIRGNSVAEAVSLGVLCLMNRNETIHRELIPDGCNVEDIGQTLALIKRLEENPVEYDALLAEQRELVTNLFFDAPVKSLQACLAEKRKHGKAHYPLLAKLDDFIWLATHR